MFYKVLFFLTLCLVPIKSASFWQGLLDEEICETKECYDAAAHIKKWMNPAFKPCEDFYEYSCGYWHSPDNTTENKVYNKSIGSRGKIINFHLKNFLLDEDIVEESRLFKMLKQFLTLCLDEESIEARGVAPAVEALRKAGGWPVIEQDWSEDKWNIESNKIAFSRGALFDIIEGYGTNWTLRIEVRKPDFRVLSEEDLSNAFQKESIKEYYKKSCELAEAFGADKSRAETEMRETVEFEIAFAQLVKRFENSSDGFNVEETTLHKLQDYISWVNWTYLLTNVLPESVPVEKVETVRISNLELLKEMGDLINNYPKRTVANYVMWYSAIMLSQYLPSKVRNITSIGEIYYKDRYEQCCAYVEESSLLGAVASYIAKQTLDDTKTATEMTQNILNELLIEIAELDWLDEETRSTALKTLRETNIIISFPEETLDLKVVEDIYKEVKINTSYFFEAIMDSNRWVSKTGFEKLGSSISDTNLKDNIETALTISAHFRIGANTIVIGGGFLHFLPLFSSKVPAYVNYGQLGGIVAHELTHALDFQTDMGEPYNRVGEDIAEHLMERWGSNETEEIYDEKTQCIIDQYSSFTDSKYTGQKLDGKQTNREDVADNGGLKLALRAYRRMASNLVSPEPKLPTLQHYSVEQLFILSLANTYCEIPDKVALTGQLHYDSHSPFEFRVKGMMMNSRDFGELFNCQKNDSMNPVEKCEVW